MDISDDGGSVRILADVPLSSMFGYSTDIRSSTQVRYCNYIFLYSNIYYSVILDIIPYHQLHATGQR
ncbi:hypothetical protein EON65_23035 [archaeon]|nr:MAG: hypothetical protein EON65_23035 [archaeon]